MPEEIVMPRLSDTMEQGTVARWLKREGDPVRKGEPLLEVETDKATMELPAYSDGVLQKILVDDGGTAPLGNSAGRYNPVYYLLVGLPFQMFGPETGLYVARLLSCLLTAVLLTLAASALLVRGGSVLARVGLVAALTPMALFLGGTVNPSGMEIAGAVAGWVGLLLLARNPGHPAVRYFAVVASVGLCAMVVSRPASVLWLAVLGVVFLIAAGRRGLGRLIRRPAVLIAAAAVAVVTVCCVLWNYLAMTSDTSTGAPPFGGRAEGFLVAYRCRL
jgi:hypothetical protein